MKFHPLLALLLPLCAFADEARTPYACDNGSAIELSFSADADGRPQARLHLADQAIILPLVPSASGALYRNGDTRLHTRGDDVILDEGQGKPRRCSRSSVPQAGSFIELSGSVTSLVRSALPPDAILTIRIQDSARRGKPLTLAEQRYELNGAQLPIPFAATVDRDLIGKNSRLSVAARIEAGGKLRFSGSRDYPAMRSGQPLAVEVALKPVAGRSH